MALEFPLVLVIDGYSAHKDPKLFLWCKQHDVILVLLYPNSTHIIQVLDIGIFSPLNNKYKDLHEDWKTINPTENFTELEFIKVLKVTNDAVMKPTTIINGWRASGLQPFNFSNVKLDKLITKAPINRTDQTPQEPSVVDAIITVPINVDNIENGLHIQSETGNHLGDMHQVEYENQNEIGSEQLDGDLCISELIPGEDENLLGDQAEEENQNMIGSEQFDGDLCIGELITGEDENHLHDEHSVGNSSTFISSNNLQVDEATGKKQM